MYFYDSNKGKSLALAISKPPLFDFFVFLIVAVGGCGYKDPEDPGNLQFDWLEVQLKIYRGRGMQVC